MNEHPSVEQLSGYLRGTLTEPQADTVARHLASCDTCDALASQLEAQPDALMNLLRTTSAPDETEPACREALAMVLAMAPGQTSSSLSDTKPPQPSHAELPEITQIGPYQLLEKLGQGGMGAVYKALHRKLKRVVAIKILPPELTRDPNAIARFEREMEAVGKLDHPHIVRATDADEHEGTHYLVMEYVQGTDLSALVHRHGPLPVADACELVRQAALGLQHAHLHGMVHRDIKPSNLMLTSDGQVKVLDMGLALLQQSAPDRELTTTGQVMGTVDYMSPEQAGGSHSVDIRADIYSLGATLYKLLTGIAPFAGQKHDTLMNKFIALAMESHRPVGEFRPDVPAELARVIDALLSKKPEDRPVTPIDVATALAPFCEDHHVTLLLDEPDTSAGETLSARQRSSTTANHRSSAFEDTASQRGGSRATPASKPQAPVTARGPESRGSLLRRPPVIALLIAAGLLGLGGIYLGVTILIKNKDGKVIGKIELPDDQTAEIVPSEKSTKPVPAPSGTNAGGKPSSPASTAMIKSLDLKPDQIVALTEHAPMNDQCLVASPAKLPGVQSWTIDTVGNRSEVYAGRMSPAAELFASPPSISPALRLWNSKNVELDRIVTLPNGCGHSIAWSPDGKYLLVESIDATKYTLFNQATNQIVRVIDPIDTKTDAYLGYADWSPDGTCFAIAHGQRGVGLSIWSAESGKELSDFGDDPYTVAVRWSPDGRYLATSANGSPFIRIWEIFKDSNKRPTLATTIDDSEAFRKHEDSSYSWHELAWSPKGKLAASSVVGKHITIWDPLAANRLDLITCKNPSAERREICWSPIDEKLAFGDGSEMRVYDAEKKEVTRALAGGGVELIQEMGWSPDGNTITATATTGGVRGSAVISWRLDSNDPPLIALGALRDSITGSKFLLNASGHPVLNENVGVLCSSNVDPEVLFSGNSRIVKLVGNDLKCLDSNTQETSTISLPKPPFTSMQVSANGNRFCCVTEEPRITVYDLDSSKKIAEFTPAGKVTRFQFSASGNVISGWPVIQGRCLLFDVDKQEQRMDLVSNEFVGGRASALSANGDRLAVANANSVMVWDLSDHSLLGTVSFKASNDLGMAWVGENLLGVVGENGGMSFIDTDKMRIVRQWPNVGWETHFRPGCPYLVCPLDGGATRFIDLKTGESRTFLWMRNDHWLVVNQDGHYRCSKRCEALFRYNALLDDGSQVTLTAAEFEQRFGWKNDPSKVPMPE